MVFSPGQNGKDKKTTCVQNGKRKGFSKRQKAGDKNRKSPSFNKEKLTLHPSVKRKELRKASHHHTPRPQKKRQETVLPSTIAEPLSSVSLVAVSPIAEPLFLSVLLQKK